MRGALRKMSEEKQTFCRADRFARSRQKARLISLFIIAGTLAFLIGCVGKPPMFNSPQKVYAYSDCGILILCPTPTPTSTPKPTPTPKPSPTVTPGPTPTATLKPTPTATPKSTITPTATATVSSTSTAPTPSVSPTEVPAISPTGGYRAPKQQEGDGSLSMIAGIVIIFFCLLLSFGVGLTILRRMLLPRIDVKLPPSGPRPWSRFRTPNPRSLVADSPTQIIWNTRSDPSTLEPSHNSFLGKQPPPPSIWP